MQREACRLLVDAVATGSVSAVGPGARRALRAAIEGTALVRPAGDRMLLPIAGGLRRMVLMAGLLPMMVTMPGGNDRAHPTYVVAQHCATSLGAHRLLQALMGKQSTRVKQGLGTLCDMAVAALDQDRHCNAVIGSDSFVDLMYGGFSCAQGAHGFDRSIRHLGVLESIVGRICRVDAGGEDAEGVGNADEDRDENDADWDLAFASVVSICLLLGSMPAAIKSSSVPAGVAVCTAVRCLALIEGI